MNNINFKNSLVVSKPSNISAIISYSKNKFYAVTKKNKVFIVNGNILPIDRVLYSLPCNNKHTPWSIRTYNKSLNNLNIVNKYWARFKDGMHVKGYIDKTKFIIL